MKGTLKLNYIVVVLVSVFSTPLAKAQDARTRFELGGEFSTIRQTQSDGSVKNFPGFGGRFDWNLSRRLAIESEVDFFPEQALPLFLTQGGQTFQAVFGVRAKVIQTRRFSVFGLVRPGLIHLTDIVDFSPDPNQLTRQRAATYFELNLGGGIEYYFSPRWVFRADIVGNPYRVTNSNVQTGASLDFAPGKIEDTTRLSLGIAYRPGVLRDNEREINVPGNWEFGPLFSTMVIAREGSGVGVRTDPGFGGYASYRFYGALYLDGDLLYFPRDTSSSGPHDGGEILQALMGVKGGIRRNHFGFFGKVRPGVQSYSRALTGLSSTTNGPATFTYDRSTNFVLDLGGILEFYPGERGTLRIELGDTHIFWGTRNVNINGTASPFSGGDMRHTIQFVIGYGWRF
jgi:Outer membrane protein beta-barrel domain